MSYLRNHRLTFGFGHQQPGEHAHRSLSSRRQRVPVVELLRGLAFHQHVAVVESLEVSFDDVGTRVVDPHDH